MRVAELWRYPVKGLRGEALERVEIAADGIPGDRRLRVADERGTITGRRKQRMVGLPATLDGDGEPLVGGEPWSSDVAADAIRDVAGEGAGLVEAENGHAFDLAPLLVVTDGAIAQLGYDRRRFRANILIEGVDGAADPALLGGRLQVGEALLFVREGCERCVITTIDPDTTEVDPEVLRRTRLEAGGMMGVYCSVLQPGVVAVDDPVKIVR